MLVHITPPAQIIIQSIEPQIPPGGGGGNGGNLVTREEFLAYTNTNNERVTRLEHSVNDLRDDLQAHIVQSNERFDALENRLGNLETRMENVEIRLDRLEVAVNEHIETSNRRFDQIDQRFNRIEDLLMQLINR